MPSLRATLAWSLLATCTLPGLAHAANDVGPLSLKYGGFCNTKQIYMTSTGAIYGKEVACAGSLGRPLVGQMLGDGKIVFAVNAGAQKVCMHTYGSADRKVTVVCSTGTGATTGAPRSFYVTGPGAASDAGEYLDLPNIDQ